MKNIIALSLGLLLLVAFMMSCASPSPTSSVTTTSIDGKDFATVSGIVTNVKFHMEAIATYNVWIALTIDGKDVNFFASSYIDATFTAPIVKGKTYTLSLYKNSSGMGSLYWYIDSIKENTSN